MRLPTTVSLVLLLLKAGCLADDNVSSCTTKPETSLFQTWKDMALSTNDCQAAAFALSQGFGTCAPQSTCIEQNGADVIEFTNPMDACKPSGNVQTFCCQPKKCTAVQTLSTGAKTTKPGYCLSPAFCSNAASETAAPNACGKELVCCVEQMPKETVHCNKYYTAVERRTGMVQRQLQKDDIRLSNQRFTNFLPFAMKVYNELNNHDRCAPLGDCSAATYLAFVYHLLMDLTTASPNKVMNEITSTLKNTAPRLASKLADRLAEFDGFITPKAFGEMLELLWSDAELNLRKYNSGTCADWIRIAHLIRGSNTTWECDLRWFALTATQYCRPTYSSNMADCADGKGVCYITGDRLPDNVCRNSALSSLGDSAHRECAERYGASPVAACCSKTPTLEASIGFADNEYRNIRIIIDPTVKEDDKLIATLIEAFTKASDMLYLATENRAVFRSVRIVLPKQWSSKLATAQAADERVSQAEFVIKPDVGREETGTIENRITMNTLQIGYCGSRGLGTVMTPADVGAEFAPSQIVKHFAFNRYGVFHEFPRYEWELELKDAINNPPGRCSQDNSTTYLRCNEDFTINVTREGESATASLTWIPDYRQNLHGIDHIVYFCDSRDCDPHRSHNKDLNNAQNLLCNKRGVMDVILENDDFFGTGTPPRPGLDTKPTFTIVHPEFYEKVKKSTGHQSRTVLVLDESSSMSQEKKVDMQKIGTSHLIDLANSRIDFAVFSYHDDTSNDRSSGFQKATRDGKSSLKSAIKVIKASDGKKCSIAKGLSDALDLLSKQGRGGQVILLAGGKNEGNQDLYLENIERIREQGVSIHTCAISSAADRQLERLALESSGKSFFVPNKANLTDTLHQMAALLKAVQNDGIERVVFLNSLKPVNVNNRNNISIFIDKGVGNNTAITVFYNNERIKSMMGTLIAPPESSSTTPSLECSDDSDSGKMICQFDEKPFYGHWTLQITPNSGHSSTTDHDVVTVMGTSTIEPEESRDAFLVSGYIAKPIIERLKGIEKFINFWEKRNSQLNTEQALVATVSYGRFAVLGADVTAVITHENGEKKWRVKLSDDGDAYNKAKGADLAANDGVYSGMFNELGGSYSGRFSVTLEVNAKPHKAFVTSDVLLGIPKSPPYLAQRKMFRNYVEFSRMLSIGMFTVRSEGKKQEQKRKRTKLDDDAVTVDAPRPGRVTQFKLQQANINQNGEAQFAFSWLAVGSDGMAGEFPSYYLLNVSNNILNVEGRSDEIDIPPELDPTLKVASFRRHGSEADTPNQPVLMTVRLPLKEWRQVGNVYFSATAYNNNTDNGEAIEGATSNIVTVYLDELMPDDDDENNGVCNNSSDSGADCDHHHQAAETENRLINKNKKKHRHSQHKQSKKISP